MICFRSHFFQIIHKWHLCITEVYQGNEGTIWPYVTLKMALNCSLIDSTTRYERLSHFFHVRKFIINFTFNTTFWNSSKVLFPIGQKNVGECFKHNMMKINKICPYVLGPKTGQLLNIIWKRCCGPARWYVEREVISSWDLLKALLILYFLLWYDYPYWCLQAWIKSRIKWFSLKEQ